MPRTEIPEVVFRQQVAGAALQAAQNASVQVNVRGGGAATVYAAETGGTTLANPLTTTSTGQVEGWLEDGAYDLAVSGVGLTSYTRRFEAISAVGGSFAARVTSTEASIPDTVMDYGASVGADNTAAIASAYAAAGGNELFFPVNTGKRNNVAPTVPPSTVMLRGPGSRDIAGQKFYRDTFGTFDEATVISVVANRSSDPTAQVMGTTDASVGERGSTAIFADNTARSPRVDSTLTTFSGAAPWTVTFGAGVNLTALKPGMLVDAGGNEYAEGNTSAFVKSVSGQVVTLNDQWRSAAAYVAAPANGTRIRIDRVNKIWGANFNVTKKTGVPLAAIAMAGLEVGIETDHDHAADGIAPVSGLHAYAVDAIALSYGTGRPTALYSARGDALVGFMSSGPYGSAGAHFLAHRNFEVTPSTTSKAAFRDEDANVDTSFFARKSAAYPRVFEMRRDTDTGGRAVTDRDGKWQWGPGDGTFDGGLERAQAGVVKLTSALQLVAIAAASVPNNTIFLDSADNVIKRKDNAGVVAAI